MINRKRERERREKEKKQRKEREVMTMGCLATRFINFSFHDHYCCSSYGHNFRLSPPPKS